MRRKRLALRVGTVLFAVAIAATACGGSGGGGSSGTTSTGTTATSDNSRLLQASAKKGGTLQALNDSDCDYWDPQRTYYANCWDQQRWISRQLITYAPQPGTPKLVGDLATSVPTSSDLKTWTYHLKSGIKFEDGTTITSKDIKYGIERVFATDVINGGPTYPIDYLQDPKNPYPGPYKDTDPNKLGLKSIETPNDQTIVFHLNKPFADWNYVMSTPQSTPVPRAKDTGAKYTFHPVSSGPYKIQSYTPGKQIVFIRNPEWNSATDPNRKALPDKIVETEGLALNDIDQRILSNQDDFYVGQTGVQITAQAKILADPALRKARTLDTETGSMRYLTVFSKVKPFDNLHCRNAVAWAVDKQAQQIARGGPVGGSIATTMLPTVLTYYQKFDLFPSPGGKGDIAKAKAELAACGYPKGFSTTLVSRSSGKEVAQAEAIQASLAKINIKVTIDKFDPSQYFSAVIGIPANVHQKKYGLAMAAWSADWPAPWPFFSSIVDGRKILAQGNSNYGELNDPVVNSGLDKASTSVDTPQQAIWTSVDKAVVKSAVYVPLLYDKSFDVYSSRLTNVYFTSAWAMIDFAALGVVP
jgi:peptide/nickel transport system substrate-binding protein